MNNAKTIAIAKLGILIAITACGDAGNAVSAVSDRQASRLIDGWVNASAYDCAGQDSQYFVVHSPQSGQSTTQFEVRNLEFDTQLLELSEAQRLNGVEFAARLEFSADTAYRSRFYRRGNLAWSNWSEWRQPAISEMQDDLVTIDRSHIVTKWTEGWSYETANQHSAEKWSLFSSLFSILEPYETHKGICGGELPLPVLSYVDAFVMEPIGGRDLTMGGVTLTVNNGDVTLTGARSTSVGKIELHTMAMVDGKMKMRRAQGFDIADGESLELKRGGNHFMMFDIGTDVVSGETVDITLDFRADGVPMTLVIEADVRAVGE